MNRILPLICSLLLSWNAGATEVAGVQLADSVHLGDRDLVLNGAGLRSKFFFKVYVAALYLPEKQTMANAIIAEEAPLRVAMYMLRDLSEKRFLNAVMEALEANNTKVEMAAMADQIRQMSDIFHLVGEAKTGDVITLDYLPGTGTQIGVNGVVRGTITGGMFHRALLKIWLGEEPVQDNLKQELLGGE